MESAKRNRKVLLVVVIIAFLLALAGGAHAQTVGPLVFQGGKGRARGEFSVRNDGVTPLIVTVEAVSFKLSPEGKSIFLPLDSHAVVKLTETAARVGARQVHAFAFEVDCQAEQCAVAILPRMVQAVHVSEGIQLGLIVPVSVYACSTGAKDCRKRQRIAAGIPDGK